MTIVLVPGVREQIVHGLITARRRLSLSDLAQSGIPSLTFHERWFQIAGALPPWATLVVAA